MSPSVAWLPVFSQLGSADAQVINIPHKSCYSVTVSHVFNQILTSPLTFSKYTLKCIFIYYYLFFTWSFSLLMWFSSGVWLWLCDSPKMQVDFTTIHELPLNQTTAPSVSLRRGLPVLKTLRLYKLLLLQTRYIALSTASPSMLVYHKIRLFCRWTYSSALKALHWNQTFINVEISVLDKSVT